MTLDGRGHTIQGEALLPVSPGQISQTSNIGGISLQSVQNVTVKGFSIKDCSFGFSLDHCSNIIISGNNVSGIWHPITFNSLSAAIFIWQGGNNIITGNRLENNEHGIYLGEHTEHNVIVENTISGSTYEGIRLEESSGNTFFHNNFDNTRNFYDSGFDHYGYSHLSTNAWDNGEEGNFWSDYNGTDADGDGIGDTPYNLELRNQDRYPLMKPWEPKLLDTTPPSISIASPENTTYTKNRVSLNFSTNEPVSWLGYSLDGQENVTITGNTTVSDLSNGLHKVTFYANDTSANTGKSKTVVFTVDVPEPFLTTIVAAASVAIVAVVGVGLLVYFKKRKR
jgi:parallel beta-helix repeat protein